MTNANVTDISPYHMSLRMLARLLRDMSIFNVIRQAFMH